MTDAHQPVTLIPAATLILMRSQRDGPPELLMMERGSELVFAAGALVFPGGRIDKGDRALAARIAGSCAGEETRDEAAARIAAIRETIEEVGIAVGLVPQPGPAATAELRAALAAGADFGALLAESGYRIDLEALSLFAWWRPQQHQRRNFDTRFFLAEAPADALGEADGSEAVHALWGTAEGILAATEAGRGHVIFPTRCNLERLAPFTSIEAVRADAASRTVLPITPDFVVQDGIERVLLPDGQGYPRLVHDVADMKRG